MNAPIENEDLTPLVMFKLGQLPPLIPSAALEANVVASPAWLAVHPDANKPGGPWSCEDPDATLVVTINLGILYASAVAPPSQWKRGVIRGARPIVQLPLMEVMQRIEKAAEEDRARDAVAHAVNGASS